MCVLLDQNHIQATENHKMSLGLKKDPEFSTLVYAASGYRVWRLPASCKRSAKIFEGVACTESVITVNSRLPTRGRPKSTWLSQMRLQQQQQQHVPRRSSRNVRATLHV